MTNVENRFSRLAFGGGEAGEIAANEALVAHEAQLVPGAKVRVYRGNPEGLVGTIVEQADGRSFRINAADGLSWTIESRNLELVRS